MDGVYGWRGSINLNEGQTSNVVVLRDGETRTMPFAIRCDAAGQENYKDGTPKKWWSKLAVVKDGQGCEGKRDRGQRSAALRRCALLPVQLRRERQSGQVSITAMPNPAFNRRVPTAPSLVSSSDSAFADPKEIAFTVGETVDLDANTTVRFAEFISDYAVRDGQVYKRSNEVGNPAAHLIVTSKAWSGKSYSFDVWFPSLDEVADNSKAPYLLQPKDLKMGHLHRAARSRTSRGNGVCGRASSLWVIGLAFVFYVMHMRFWALPVRDEQTGSVSRCGLAAARIAIATHSNKRFTELVEEVEKELKTYSGNSSE